MVLIAVLKNEANVSCMEIRDQQGRKEESVLFNDTLYTLYLWLYGIIIVR